MFIPTTTCRILQENAATNDYGDDIDTYKAVRSGIPAHLWEESKQVYESADSRVLTLRVIRAILPGSETVAQGDRIQDEKDDQIYVITHVATSNSFVTTMPLRLDLERVS